jgi:hypothetical protein
LNSADLLDETPARGWLPWGTLAPFLALAFVIATGFAGIPLIEPLVSLGPLGNPLDAQALFAYTLATAWLLFWPKRAETAKNG